MVPKVRRVGGGAAFSYSGVVSPERGDIKMMLHLETIAVSASKITLYATRGFRRQRLPDGE
jgi:hypothetical protein